MRNLPSGNTRPRKARIPRTGTCACASAPQTESASSIIPGAPGSGGSTAAMRVRLRVSDRELVEDLPDFLPRRGGAGERVEGTTDVVEVSPPHTLHEHQAQMELDLLLRVWEALHPDAT